MIYVVISDGLNRQDGFISKNGDCRVLRQPHCILPKEIKEYTEKTKNESMRAERSLAYTTLLCSLEKFFSVKNPVIEKNQNGKPYLKDSDIFISISHCDGVAVVALSDEGEIGVDIQSAIDDGRARRLNDRFLSKIRVKQEIINIKYFSLDFTDEKIIFYEILPEQDKGADFLSKWVYTESIIKCFGITFSDISKINELADETKTQTVSIKNFKIATTVAK